MVILGARCQALSTILSGKLRANDIKENTRIHVVAHAHIRENRTRANEYDESNGKSGRAGEKDRGKKPRIIDWLLERVSYTRVICSEPFASTPAAKYMCRWNVSANEDVEQQRQQQLCFIHSTHLHTMHTRKKQSKLNKLEQKEYVKLSKIIYEYISFTFVVTMLAYLLAVWLPGCFSTLLPPFCSRCFCPFFPLRLESARKISHIPYQISSLSPFHSATSCVKLIQKNIRKKNHLYKRYVYKHHRRYWNTVVDIATIAFKMRREKNPHLQCNSVLYSKWGTLLFKKPTKTFFTAVFNEHSKHFPFNFRRVCVCTVHIHRFLTPFTYAPVSLPDISCKCMFIFAHVCSITRLLKGSSTICTTIVIMSVRKKPDVYICMNRKNGLNSVRGTETGEWKASKERSV